MRELELIAMYGILSEMKSYELTVILEPKATEAKKKKISETINETVEKLKGKVGTTADWGEKEFGKYLHYIVEMDSKAVKDLNNKLRAENEITRYLIVGR